MNKGTIPWYIQSRTEEKTDGEHLAGKFYHRENETNGQIYAKIKQHSLVKQKHL